MSDEVPDANAVITFIDFEGRRWLCAALLGPLVAEGDDSTVMPVDEMMSSRIRWVRDFKVIRRED